MKGSNNALASLIFLLTFPVTMLAGYLFGTAAAVVACIFCLYLSGSPRQIAEWDRGVLLRLGKFKGVLEPGITWVVPGIDEVSDVVDMRIRSTSFSAEKTLTSDTVPVNVDAVLFWVVTDAEKAVTEVEDFFTTINWAAQTTLRDVIGQTELVRMISDRTSIDEELQKLIDDKTSDWGITVQSVEIRDMKIPAALEDAMSRKAQADREKEARIILAESELRVADEMEKAARVYHKDPIALQIRAMNMTYESIKERGALMVVPSDMVNSMNGSVMAMGANCFERNKGSAA